MLSSTTGAWLKSLVTCFVISVYVWMSKTWLISDGIWLTHIAPANLVSSHQPACVRQMSKNNAFPQCGSWKVNIFPRNYKLIRLRVKRPAPETDRRETVPWDMAPVAVWRDVSCCQVVHQLRLQGSWASSLPPVPPG